MIIAVDFDGTLCMGTYPEIGSPKPYAVEVMNKLKADGHYLILWTCRWGERLEKAVNWMLSKASPSTVSTPTSRRTSPSTATTHARSTPTVTSTTSR